MSNPFDDLEDDDDDGIGADEEAESEVQASSPAAPESDATTEPSSTSPDPNPEPRSAEPEPRSTDPESRSTRTTDQSPVTTDRRSRDPTPPSETGPAFEYSAVRQRPLYARSETWDDFEKTLRTSIAPTLAEDDVFDEETREIHDAVLRLAAAEPERVVELVLEARRQTD